VARGRRRKRVRQAETDRARPRPEPRLPSALQRTFANAGLELARRELAGRRWRSAFEYAEQSRATDRPTADAIMAEASAREARRSALCGRFVDAEHYAKRAVELRPSDPSYQERRRLVRLARDAVLRDFGQSLFPDTVGPSRGHWWEHDLLARVRGWDGSDATVPAPLILGETSRGVLEDVYAVGSYQPWHVAGPTPMFTSYVKALKPGGRTIPYAAILLRQGLTEETDWIEEIDAIVPAPTSLDSFEARGFELTEDLAQELGLRLCIPVADAFEGDPYAVPTHSLSGYTERSRALANSLRLKVASSALLASAEAALVVDDVVTYGSTFEACALKLRERYPQLRVYGAALAYTETQHRRERALAEREDMEGFMPDG
jgi:predicted amidophosphoribosyltransferase